MFCTLFTSPCLFAVRDTHFPHASLGKVHFCESFLFYLSIYLYNLINLGAILLFSDEWFSEVNGTANVTVQNLGEREARLEYEMYHKLREVLKSYINFSNAKRLTQKTASKHFPIFCFFPIAIQDLNIIVYHVT